MTHRIAMARIRSRPGSRAEDVSRSFKQGCYSRLGQDGREFVDAASLEIRVETFLKGDSMLIPLEIHGLAQACVAGGKTWQTIKPSAVLLTGAKSA